MKTAREMLKSKSKMIKHLKCQRALLILLITILTFSYAISLYKLNIKVQQLAKLQQATAAPKATIKQEIKKTTKIDYTDLKNYTKIGNLPVLPKIAIQ